jgi:hypothetical protein
MMLVTTSHSLLLIDPAAGSIAPIHRGLGLYFGIATDGERYFVAARGRMVSSAVPAEEERGRILVFDRALRLVDEWSAPFPMRDLHEILWHQGKLWLSCSFDNMVAILEVATSRWESWYPFGPTPQPPYDLNHLNSFAVLDGALAVVAHNFGASELLRFDIESRELLSRAPFGMQSHNIRAKADGSLITCSSAEGAIVGQDGWRLDVGGFPRGILMGGDETYVGISQLAERQDRDLTTGSIMVFDPEWRPLRTLELPGEGLILDIQHFEGAATR